MNSALTVTLELNMAEIITIRNAITTKLIVTEDNKRRFKNGLDNKSYSIAQKCMLHDEVRACNDTLTKLRTLEHRIDSFVRNQTGEDM